ncbi:MAG: DUF2306 domain-containing protein [Rhizobiales bacterium]|jgi:hypothetical protein|nr:DUF2306 domain-containing protein [Hyphomicrobiales bacterium]
MKANISDHGSASNIRQRNVGGKPQNPKLPIKARSATWLVVALILLSAIPIAGGVFRLSQLAGGAEITPANARFFAAPLPVVLHIVSAGVYAILGAFQFVPSLRKRRSGWHRIAGRLLIPSGLIVALSGLWMTLFYPWPTGDGVILYGLRLLFGSAMLLSILLGIAAIRRRDFVQHGDWMLRGYAIGLGAGTQVLALAAGEIIAGPPSELSRALLMGAGWVINLAVAEWIIRRRPARPAHKIAAATSQLQ